MNIVKLHQVDKDGNHTTWRTKVTQSTKWRRKRTSPYPHEVYNWALKNGWFRTKHQAFAAAGVPLKTS